MDGFAGKQFVERYDAVAFGFEVADDLRDGLDSRFMDVVRQNNGISRCFRHFGCHLFGIAVFPVERVDVPTDNGTIDEHQFIVRKGSVREAEIGRLAARNLLSDVVGERYLAAGFVERYFGKILMVVGMVADVVPLFGYTPQGLFLYGSLLTEYEEGRFYVLFPKDVE